MSESKVKEKKSLIPFDLRRRYEFAIVSAALDVFEDNIPNYYTFNQENLLATINLDEEDQENLKILHLDTLDDDLLYPLESLQTRGEITLVTFFSLQMVDIPKPFSRAKSLYRSTASMPRLRFLNMITRHGKKSKTSKAYSLALRSISQQYFSLTVGKTDAGDWRFLYSIFNYKHISYSTKSVEISHKTVLRSTNDPLETKYMDEQSRKFYAVSSDNWVQNTLFSDISEYVPIFSFYVKKVDKLKRRHSRGKSGKYSIAWKYVPKYRRLLTTLRWLAQDVKFQKSKTFELRLLRSLESFFFDRDSHLVPRLRQFVHSFVFQHHKKSLLKTLKSVSS